MSATLPELHRLEHQALLLLLIVAAALVVSALFKRLINRRLQAQHLAPVMAARLHTLRRWAILVLAVVAVLEVLDVFGSAWALISAGLAAVAVGFVAAWSVLSNVTSALLLLAFRPFRMGERVELMESGAVPPIGGRVVDMNLMYTTLAVEELAAGDDDAPDETAHQYLRVPNNLFFQKVIRTYARGGPNDRTPFFTRLGN